MAIYHIGNIIYMRKMDVIPEYCRSISLMNIDIDSMTLHITFMTQHQQLMTNRNIAHECWRSTRDGANQTICAYVSYYH